MHTSPPPRLVLASASPARRRILQAAGIDPDVIVSGVDESVVESSDPARLCLVLARMKAQAVVERLRPTADPAVATLVLGCDSVLGFDGAIFGKPADADEAVERWRRMRGRSGVLHTGHHLAEVSTGRHAEAVVSTVVHFAEISDAEIAAYVATGEPLEVAGGFTIDGIGASFVERIDGDPGTVIGLSLPLLRRLLADLHHCLLDLWREPLRTPTVI